MSASIRCLRMAPFVISAVLFTSGAPASADSSFRFNVFLGNPPPPVVVYPAPRVVYYEPVVYEPVIVEHYYVERYPVVYYHHHRGGPPPWAASWHKHKKHGKHHWKD